MIDIKEKLTKEEKGMFENLRIEMLVLSHLAEEKKRQTVLLLTQVLTKLGYNPQLYGLEFNAAQDSWEVKLRPDAIALPGLTQHPKGRLLHG